MKSQRFSPTVSCYTAYLRKKPSKKKNRTWLRHQGKKREHLAHANLAQIRSKKKRAPGPLTWPVTKQKKLSQIPSKKKRAPGSPQPGSDTKQKKRVHLDHSDLAQIHSCSLDIIWFFFLFTQ